ncbi:MAG TPA: GIY-YIG nuclease family protein [Rhodanobacteraceae bacterium]
MATSPKQPCVYILANRRNGTLYIGVTSDLPRRVREHKDGVVSGFTRRYRVHHLVWLEAHETMQSAIAREKAIEQANPYWRDLYDELA